MTLRVAVAVLLVLEVYSLRLQGRPSTPPLYAMPPLREFLPLPGMYANPGMPTVRVQQFNLLADGLAAQRPDLGKFSRIDKSVLDWEVRKDKLLREITQYDADIITLQECDHYHDFFQPRLDALGYSGYFVSKPTSACLEVGSSNDGCALFVKRDRLRVTSCETKTLALSIAKLTEGGELEEPGLDSSSIQAQNQVALIAVIEFVSVNASGTGMGIGTGTGTGTGMEGVEGVERRDNGAGARIAAVPTASAASTAAVGDQPARKWYQSDAPFEVKLPVLLPPLLVATVHLKSSKSATGERYRQKGILQVLNDLARISRSLGRMGRPPAVILTGDFNAIPDTVSTQLTAFGGNGYAPLTYRAVKIHSLGLRSVYNDDLPRSLVPSCSDEVYTTWKARKVEMVRDGGEIEFRESVVKRCIDYIFYMPYRRGPYRSYDEVDSAASIRAVTSSQVVVSLLMRFTVYLIVALLPLSALLSPELTAAEKIQLLSVAVAGLSFFEIFSEGSIFRPEIEDSRVIEGIDYEVEVNDLEGGYLNGAGKAIASSAGSGKDFIKKVKTAAKRAQTTSRYGNPGMQAVRVVDLMSEAQVGAGLLPNSAYPSDHLSIVADMRLMW